jgi:uncharacterized protein YndB with AHSA1/START domain
MSTNSQTQQGRGALEVRDDGKYVLRFERRLAHPPDRVWGALTEPDRLRHWFPTDIEGERKAGARIRFVFREGEGPTEEMSEVLEDTAPKTLDGEITDLDEPRLLAYTWGDEALRWELRPDGDGCLLAFTHTFDARGGNFRHPEGPRKKGARDASGWELCLNGLEAVLDGRRIELDQEPDERWQGLYERYVREFG